MPRIGGALKRQVGHARLGQQRLGRLDRVLAEPTLYQATAEINPPNPAPEIPVGTRPVRASCAVGRLAALEHAQQAAQPMTIVTRDGSGVWQGERVVETAVEAAYHVRSVQVEA